MMPMETRPVRRNRFALDGTARRNENAPAETGIRRPVTQDLKSMATLRDLAIGQQDSVGSPLFTAPTRDRRLIF